MAILGILQFNLLTWYKTENNTHFGIRLNERNTDTKSGTKNKMKNKNELQNL